MTKPTTQLADSISSPQAGGDEELKRTVFWSNFRTNKQAALDKLITAGRTRLCEKIEKEVIGNDDDPFKQWGRHDAASRNELRTVQRQALRELIPGEKGN